MVSSVGLCLETAAFHSGRDKTKQNILVIQFEEHFYMIQQISHPAHVGAEDPKII